MEQQQQQQSTMAINSASSLFTQLPSLLQAERMPVAKTLSSSQTSAPGAGPHGNLSSPCPPVGLLELSCCAGKDR